MIRRNKWLLRFSIIYWLLILFGMLLNGLSLKKVPIETYGLRAYFFSPTVDASYYLPGLYNPGIGYYFITFPSSKQYVLDTQVSVINKNLEKIEVTYSFCYRLDPSKIYQIYQKMGQQYEQYLIAAVNNIVSGVFMKVDQANSRVDVQNQVVTNLNANNDKVSTVLGGAVVVEGLWVNQLGFKEEIQKDYQNSLFLSDSYQQSYETTQLQFQKTKLQSRAVQEQIGLAKQELVFNARQLYNNRFSEVVATQQSSSQERQTRLSSYYQMKRIWTYYNSTRLIFK